METLYPETPLSLISIIIIYIRNFRNYVTGVPSIVIVTESKSHGLRYVLSPPTAKMIMDIAFTVDGTGNEPPLATYVADEPVGNTFVPEELDERSRDAHPMQYQ